MQTTPQSLLVLPLPQGSRSLVFGLNWFAVVGSQVDAAARRRARQSRATHYVAGGVRASAGGWARLDRRLRRRELHSAAQAYASLHADDASACVVPLPDGRYWLAAAQDGAVITRGDRVYEQLDDAQQALDALLAARPELRIRAGDQVLAALSESLGTASRLRRVGNPVALRAGMFGLLAAVALTGWWQRDAAQAPAAARQDAESIWQTALHTWRSGIRIHAPAELRGVVDSLYGMPLAVQGWRLEQAGCRPEQVGWRCEAMFHRVQPGATYLALTEALPPGWRADFTDLDKTTLYWHVKGRGLSLASVGDAMHPVAHFPSSLQRVAHAFSQVRLGPEIRMAMPAPLSVDGLPVPAPASLGTVAEVKTRRLVLDGPLRSLGVLALDETLAGWTSLRLTLVPGRPADLSGSALQLQLEGVLYDQN